jgi:hypothetical protein
VAVYQAIEHVGARGFTDGGRDPGGPNASLALYIHALMVNEVFLYGKWQIK